MVTIAQIELAKREIGHRCDGPITPFVLICRATEYATACNRENAPRAAAEALAELLEEYGWLNEGVEETGS